MNILILSHKPPYPIVDGSCHAMDRFLRDLLKSMPKGNIDYISVATQIIPVTGQNLPLISSGGSSAWMTCISLGMILSVSSSIKNMNSEKE